MTRDWFKCDVCGIECDNSVKAPMNAPGEPDRAPEICATCDASFCPCCDSLYPAPEPAPSYGYFATCEECGYLGYFGEEVARNLKELNHRMEKETHQ